MTNKVPLRAAAVEAMVHGFFCGWDEQRRFRRGTKKELNEKRRREAKRGGDGQAAELLAI